MRKNLVLWLGISVIVVMGIIPPWKLTSILSDSEGIIKGCRPSTYEPLWDPPGGAEAFDSLSIDFNRLCLQWGLVALVTAGLMYTLPRRSEPAGIPKKHPSGKQESKLSDS